jgi:hypothetical protein
MLFGHDGTSYRRVGGKKGDRTPIQAFRRLGSAFTAVGGEIELDLSILSQPISYTPGLRQLNVYRGSGNKLATGIGYFEITPSKIRFATALLANEIIEVEKNFELSGVMALPPRLDWYEETAVAAQTIVTAPFSWRRRKPGEKTPPMAFVFVAGQKMRLGVDYTETDLLVENTNQIVFAVAMTGGENIEIYPWYVPIDTSAQANSFNGDQISSHLADASDAHDASAISNIPAGNLAATNLQTAVNELQSDVDGRVARAGDTMTGVLDLGGFKITSLGTPVAATDAATKAYADSVGGGGLGTSLASTLTTMVTVAPSVIGEWRPWRRAASTQSSDANANPTIQPNSTDGVKFYTQGTNAGSDAVNQPSGYDFYIGLGKQITLASAWQQAAKVAVIDITPHFNAAFNTFYGLTVTYDPMTGIVTVRYSGSLGPGPANLSAGILVSQASGSSGGSAVSAPYFDLYYK